MSRSIIIKNVEKTNLNYDAFKSVVELYSECLKENIYISFDKRIKSHGQYSYDDKKLRHYIQLHPVGEFYTWISTLLHEIAHARQWETFGSVYFDKKAPNTKDKETAYYYAPCEVEARLHENKHVLSAVSFYQKKVLEFENHNCYDSSSSQSAQRSMDTNINLKKGNKNNGSPKEARNLS